VVKLFKARDGKEGSVGLMHELGSSQALGSLGLERSQVVGALGAFRAGQEAVYIMEGAAGRDAYQILREVGRYPRGSYARRDALATALVDVARMGAALGEMHRKSPSHVVSRSNQDFVYFSALSKLAELGAKARPDGMRLPEDVGGFIKAQLEGAARSYLGAVTEGNFTHGDAHPGNFFIDEGGRVTLIDVQALTHSIGHDGRGTADWVSDVTTFTRGISLNNKLKNLNLSSNEINGLMRVFRKGYAGEFGGAKEPLRSKVYRLRLYISWLQSAQSPEEFSYYLQEARKYLWGLGYRPRKS
jgi:hypothetical protein